MRRIRRRNGEPPLFPLSILKKTTYTAPQRPNSKNAGWEDPPADGAPFDYDAQPSKFYLEIESIGNLEPDAVVQQGIKVIQQKLAAVLQELEGSSRDGGRGVTDGFGAGDDGGAGGMVNGGGGDYMGEQGYTTPYVNNGGASTWGGGATPYGATPYGQQNGWAQ